jgi:hypothetical protein
MLKRIVPMLLLLAGSLAAAETAVVHFYRDNSQVGAWRKLPVFMDGSQIVDIKNGKHIALRIPAGSHLFSSKSTKESVSVLVEAGQEYFIQADIWMSFTKAHWRVKQMSAEQGGLDIKRLERAETKNVSAVAQSWIVP